MQKLVLIFTAVVCIGCGASQDSGTTVKPPTPPAPGSPGEVTPNPTQTASTGA